MAAMAGHAWRWLCLAFVGVALAADPPAKTMESGSVFEALSRAKNEEEAKPLVRPFLDDLKTLDNDVLYKVVMRQWWGLAREIVAKSHEQSVDLSFAVRKAVRDLKDEADELLRTLNPGYGKAQQVSPAFQWAQNDTCIFLTIKFTVRWNAPGALEVKESAVNITDSVFSFSGLGQHSNNKYRYVLGLDMFDGILEKPSTWSLASVGKLSATIKKRWPRKWPRLLADKKTKINNMHVWMEMQEKLDSTLGGMSTVSNSPVTCKSTQKLYCIATDSCKKPDGCMSCPGKTTPQPDMHLCTGMPTEKGSISFKDTDYEKNQIGGDVKITKARNEFDIDQYMVYFGKNMNDKLELDGKQAVIGEAHPTGGSCEVEIKQNTDIPTGATHLLVFSKNAFGEFGSPGSSILKDAVLPKDKPGGVQFEDEDGEVSEVSGMIKVQKASSEDELDEYAIHWGKSATRKTNSGSLIKDLEKAGKDLTHYMTRNTKIPESATHILVFSKNEHGELPTPASVKVLDNTKACATKSAADCAQGLRASPDEDPAAKKVKTTVTVERAKDDSKVEYSLYWGRKNCGGSGQQGAKNGHIQDMQAPSGLDMPATFDVEGDVPLSSTHLLVFTRNKHGESDYCQSTEFRDDDASEGKKEL